MDRARMPSAVSLDQLLARADLWRGDRLATAGGDTVPTGHAELDAVLPGGGWPSGALVEILVDGGGRGEAALVAGIGELSLLLPALARQSGTGGWLFVVAPPCLPHAPAWVAAGIDPARLVVVEAEARDRFWAIDRILRCTAVDCVVAWLPQADATLLRRLQLAAEAGRATLFAFRPASLAAQASPAPLRLLASGGDDGLQLRILKRRGPPLASVLRLDPRHLPAGLAERRRLPAPVAAIPARRDERVSLPGRPSRATA